MIITFGEFLRFAEIQSGFKCYFYDYEKDERIEITKDEAEDFVISYIYAEDDIICVECYRYDL